MTCFLVNKYTLHWVRSCSHHIQVGDGKTVSEQEYKCTMY